MSWADDHINLHEAAHCLVMIRCGIPVSHMESVGGAYWGGCVGIDYNRQEKTPSTITFNIAMYQAGCEAERKAYPDIDPERIARGGARDDEYIEEQLDVPLMTLRLRSEIKAEAKRIVRDSLDRYWPVVLALAAELRAKRWVNAADVYRIYEKVRPFCREKRHYIVEVPPIRSNPRRQYQFAI